MVLLGACVSDRGSADRGDAERRARWKAYWQLYQQGDPAWEQARDAWWSEGAEARDVLVLNLVGDLVRRAPDPTRVGPDRTPVWKRPLDEIVGFARRDPARVLPVLEESLRAAREPLAASAVAAALVEAGGSSALLRIVRERRDDDSRIGVGAACQALLRVGGAEAVDAVGSVLRREEDWRLRARAAEALGGARYADRHRAAQALLPGLDDPDPFVVRRVLDALGRLGVRAVAPEVAARLSRALESGEAEIAEAAVSTLERLTGVRGPGDDPLFWRQAAAEAARTPEGGG